MINRYRFLIPEGKNRVRINSKRVGWENPQFYSELKDYLSNYQKGDEFVINLAQIERADSSCVASLIRILQEANEKKIKLVLENISDNLKRNLEIAFTHDAFHFRRA